MTFVARFSLWRKGGYAGVKRTTQWLLQASVGA